MLKLNKMFQLKPSQSEGVTNMINCVPQIEICETDALLDIKKQVNNARELTLRTYTPENVDSLINTPFRVVFVGKQEVCILCNCGVMLVCK